MAEMDPSAGGGSPFRERGPTFAEQEAAMKTGRGRMLAGIVGLCVALLAGLIFLISGEDEQRIYGEAGKQINGLKQKHFERFWACALQGADLGRLKSNEDLLYQINLRGARGASRYGRQVREKCLETLGVLESKLTVLILPEDLQADLAKLKQSAGELYGAWSAYAAYLDDPKLEYDEQTARPRLLKIARGWYEFKKAHASLNKTIKKKLGR